MDYVPTSTELTLLQEKLNLALMSAGETIMVGAYLTTPAAWAAAHTASHTVLSFGDHSSGSASGGLDFGVNSSERPQVIPWAKAATATGKAKSDLDANLRAIRAPSEDAFRAPTRLTAGRFNRRMSPSAHRIGGASGISIRACG